MTFAVTADAVQMTYTGVNAAGKSESSGLVFHPDGQEHAVSPQAPALRLPADLAAG